MRTDLHIHTTVSDGLITPEELFTSAARLGVGRVSITDHEAVGAYSLFGEDLFQLASLAGLELVSGIELDSDYAGRETHVLGYGIDLDHPELSAFLSSVQELRRRRVSVQISAIREKLGPGIVDESEVIAPPRQTLMKPHLIRPLLATGRFASYSEASQWLSKEAKSPVRVPKPAAEEMVQLVKRAGGTPVLAHPGYSMKEDGLDLRAMLRDLVLAGLEGVEVDYRYAGTSPHFPDLASQREMVAEVGAVAREFGLAETCGSDAHTVGDMESFHRCGRHL